MTRVMVDIETLGTDPGAAIISIGAVKFDSDGLGEEFYANVDLQSCQDIGLGVDADTLDWWLSQDSEVQDVLTGGNRIGPILRQLRDFLEDVDEIWANSPSFDCEILNAAYEALGWETPWDYYQERDFRTLRELPIYVEVDMEGESHNALDDAKNQARETYKTLSDLEV